MLTPTPGCSFQYCMTDSIICFCAADDELEIDTSRSLHRSMQDRTCDRDFDPMKQIHVTYASVLHRRGSSASVEACVWICSIIGSTSESGAFRLRRERSSRPSLLNGVSGKVSNDH